MPLTHVATGTPVEVLDLAAMPAQRASRLTAFGLTPGTFVALSQRTPVPVVISEAVRLAKAYSTERSGGFVNGVLSKLVSERTPA